jgi:hypothetical protein
VKLPRATRRSRRFDGQPATSGLPRTTDIIARAPLVRFGRVGPGISPRASHRSGLDTLASSGSCHRTKAAAFRRELELLLLPVGSLPTSVTCPLRSTSITPASSLLQGSPPLSGASVLSASVGAACAFSLGIAGQVLTFRTRARLSFAPPPCRMPLGQPQDIPQTDPGGMATPRFSHRLIRFDTSSAVRLRSPLSILPVEILFQLFRNVHHHRF